MLTNRNDPIEGNHWQGEGGWRLGRSMAAQLSMESLTYVKVLKGKWVWRQEFKGVLC